MRVTAWSPSHPMEADVKSWLEKWFHPLRERSLGSLSLSLSAYSSWPAALTRTPARSSRPRTRAHLPGIPSSPSSAAVTFTGKRAPANLLLLDQPPHVGAGRFGQHATSTACCGSAIRAEYAVEAGGGGRLHRPCERRWGRGRVGGVVPHPALPGECGACAGPAGARRARLD